jgi:hypothetical protein
MTQSDSDVPEAAAVVVGRPYRDWLTGFIGRGDGTLSERVILERLLDYFRGAACQEQQDILRGNRRLADRADGPLEVLPVSRSVYR